MHPEMQPYEGGERLQSAWIKGVLVQAGSPVRLHPSGRADILDLALRGKFAAVDSIEVDNLPLVGRNAYRLLDLTPGDATQRGVAWLVDAVESGRFRDPSPIGFYFAKLWYYEKLYPLIFTVAALGRATRRVTSSGSAAGSA